MVQLYFEKITDVTASRSNSIIFDKALKSLATDAGLHPLVPYFIYFVAEDVNIFQFSVIGAFNFSLNLYITITIHAFFNDFRLLVT